MQEVLCLGCGPVARVGTLVVICHIVGSWPLAPLIRGSPGTLMAPWWVPQQLWAR